MSLDQILELPAVIGWHEANGFQPLKGRGGRLAIVREDAGAIDLHPAAKAADPADTAHVGMEGVIGKAERLTCRADDKLLGLRLHREDGHPDGRAGDEGGDHSGKNAKRENGLEADGNDGGESERRDKGDRCNRVHEGAVQRGLSLRLHGGKLRRQPVRPDQPRGVMLWPYRLQARELILKRRGFCHLRPLAIPGASIPQRPSSQRSCLDQSSRRDQRSRSGDAICASRVSKP